MCWHASNAFTRSQCWYDTWHLSERGDTKRIRRLLGIWYTTRQPDEHAFPIHYQFSDVHLDSDWERILLHLNDGARCLDCPNDLPLFLFVRSQKLADFLHTQPILIITTPDSAPKFPMYLDKNWSWSGAEDGYVGPRRKIYEDL